MRVLFVHDTGPAQFKHLVSALAADPANRVIFLARRFDDHPQGVDCRKWRYRRLPSAAGHPYLLPLESAVCAGHAVFEACVSLKQQGFHPEVIVAHAGFGPGLYLKEVFPRAKVLGYFEWLYRGPGRDIEYLTGAPPAVEVACRARTRNAGILLELASCDAAVAPTHFQAAQFPRPLRDKLQVVHDGIDTDYFCPAKVPPTSALADLPADAEILTYATRGMEPMRGFPQFMAALGILLELRPKLHVLIAGEDRAVYSPALRNGRSYREQALIDTPLAASARVRFLGPLALQRYRDVLRVSHVHVYLTAPFVLSWSLLEAMSCACLVVASNTQPVAEVMRNDREGLLVDFRDPLRLARRIAQALDGRERYAAMTASARLRVLRNYSTARSVPRQLGLLRGLADGARAGTDGEESDHWRLRAAAAN